MLNTRRSARVLAVAILIWLVATALVAVWLLSMWLPDPSSHEAGDAILGMVILSPQLVVALIGLVALNAIRTNSRRAPRWGLAWGLLQTLVGLALASRFLGLLASVVTEGRRISWYDAEDAIVFAAAGTADYTHWGDWVSVALAVVAVVGLIAATVLAMSPGRGSSAAGGPAQA